MLLTTQCVNPVVANIEEELRAAKAVCVNTELRDFGEFLQKRLRF